MGFAPAEVNKMTFWEFACVSAGWRMANGIKPKIEAPTDAEFEAAIARH